MYSYTGTTTKPNQIIRSDRRCGPEYPLPDGSSAQCDPVSEFYCCSKWGYCGDTDQHCECPDCINYRKVDLSGILYRNLHDLHSSIDI